MSTGAKHHGDARAGSGYAGAMASDAEINAAREAVVREHMDSENRLDFEATIATFHRPRYELCPRGEIHDGEAAVREYYRETRAAFPDQRNRITALYSGEGAVIVEFVLEGTHQGGYRGLPATGRSFSCAMAAFFLFEPGSRRISCERVYFDSNTILQQLGIAHDPLTLKGRVATVLNHPVTIGGAALRRLLRR
jgi:steroid delta-isomerase-like uncharacterized protein